MKRYLEGIRTSHGSSHESRETAKKNILRDKQMYAHQEIFEGKQMSKERMLFFSLFNAIFSYCSIIYIY